MKFLTTVGPALIVSKGYAAPEVEATYRRALELCKQLDDGPHHFSALHGLWYVYYVRSELDTAIDLAEQLVELAKAGEDSVLVLAAHRSVGYTLAMRGEFEAAQTNLERVITLYDPVVHGAFAFRHGGADPGVGCLSQRAWTDWALGFPEQAVSRCEKGLALAGELGHPFSEVFALTSKAAVHQFRDEPEATLVHAEAALTLATKQGFPLYVGWAKVLRGWALFTQGGGAEAIAEIRDGIETARATGSRVRTPHWRGLLASAYSRIGRAAEGLIEIHKALAEAYRGPTRNVCASNGLVNNPVSEWLRGKQSRSSATVNVRFR